MKQKRWIPIAIVAAFLAWFIVSLLPNRGERMQIDEFGALPVLTQGRIQPWDSLARNSLLQIRNKQTVYIPSESGRGKSVPATQWLLEVMARPESADEMPIFRIDNPELKGMLRLDDAEKHFSFAQLSDSIEEIESQARWISEKESQLRSPFERQTMKLYQALWTYHKLKLTLKPRNSDDPAAELESFRQMLPEGIAAVRAREQSQDYDRAAFNRILQALQRYDQIAKTSDVMAIPPKSGEDGRDKWQTMGQGILSSIHEEALPEPVPMYAAMLSGYRQGNATLFNQALGQYQDWLQNAHADYASRGNREAFFNHAQFFYKAMVIYVTAGLLVFLYWFRMTPWLERSGYYLLGLGVVIHTIGLVLRMVIEGRPPVTNLYSSAVFIGWGAVLLGLFLERFFREGIGVITGAVIGFLSLIVAHHLSLGGDTMQVLRAVLDTNFWLATHVVTITIGYSSNFVAGFLGLVLVLRGVFTKSLSEVTQKSLGRMIYGIICFATFFSFIGTVLGGIWADQSWGRFWGWDPKENGALIIVLWNAIILHARWGRMVNERGLASLAIFGNIVTSYSWFGVNMLGVGLHSYGFMDQAFHWLVFFIVTQLVVMGNALLPRFCWASFAGRQLSSTRPFRMMALTGNGVAIVVAYLFGIWGLFVFGLTLILPAVIWQKTRMNQLVPARKA